MMTDGETIGATAGEDESDLLVPHLFDRAARDLAELEAIDRVYEQRVFRGRKKKQGSGWLTETLLRDVHREMFGAIWSWGGRFRTTPTNIGIDWHQIPEQVRLLCGDFAAWDAAGRLMPTLEIAARLQNRLTRIHPFKNGNGRHARLITDVFLRTRDHPLPLWPQIQRLAQGDQIRKRYLAAMREADQQNYADLIQFIEDCVTGRIETS